MEKELKIVPPEGYEIDRERSTLECIKFKPIEKKWEWREGYFINEISDIIYGGGINSQHNRNIFATMKQAKSARAMAQISQIMANDERLGGVVSDEEWDRNGQLKYTIERDKNKIIKTFRFNIYAFLAFHTSEQRDLFLKENEDLVKDYLMIE